MDTKDILKIINSHPSAKVKVAITDIDGILRGKIMAKDKFISAMEGGFGFCDVTFGWDSADVAYDNGKFTGWHSGYPDAMAHLDPNSFRQIPWENDLPFMLGDLFDNNGTPAEVCPRNLLKKVRQECIDLGFAPNFSQEFEWFNFQQTPQEWADKNYANPRAMTPGMFGYSLLRASLKHEYFNDLFDLMGKFGVPLEGLHTETGPGVYEAAIMYGDILESADRAVLFKSGAKEIAYRHGIMASFMAKQTPELPGCSGHVHQSLWDGSNNAFFDASQVHNMSELFQSYLAGQLYCLPHILPMFAPTINSFKRLVEGAWAPTTLTWAADNRTVALRVMPGSEKSCRLESRVPGSDSNPYLALAGSLAAGLYGIKNKMKLSQPETKGNGYLDTQYGTLPPNLWEATQAMKNSDVAKQLFGEGFVDHFTRTREWEWREFMKNVTDWEMKRYFEII